MWGVAVPVLSDSDVVCAVGIAGCAATSKQTACTGRVPKSKRINFSRNRASAAFVPSTSFVVFFLCGKVDDVAQQFHVAHVRRDASAHLQRRNGDE